MKFFPALALFALCLPTLAQGPLVPPTVAGPEIGPTAAANIFGPQATMKTLHQVEPRTPISSLPYTISLPGSYYLTRNLTVASGNGITITADGVDLDLAGFTLFTTSPTPSGFAILLTNQVGVVRIANGNIRGLAVASGGGWKYGVAAIPDLASEGSSVLVEKLILVGCVEGAIHLLDSGGPTMVSDCLIHRCGTDPNGGVAVGADVVKNCVVRKSQLGVASYLAFDSLAEECKVGFGYQEVIANCLAGGETYGILAGVVSASSGSATGTNGEGIYADVATACYGDGPSVGVNARVVAKSYGRSNGGRGIASDGVVLASSAIGNGPLHSLSAKVSIGNHSIVSTGAGIGLATTVAVGNYAESVNGDAVDTYVSLANYGIASGSGAGVDGSVIGASYGQSGTGNGLYASRAVQNSYGRTDGFGFGLRGGVVQNAIGASASGVDLSAGHNMQNSASE